jgi:hypothetical protein
MDRAVLRRSAMGASLGWIWDAELKDCANVAATVAQHIICLLIDIFNLFINKLSTKYVAFVANPDLMSTSILVRFIKYSL